LKIPSASSRRFSGLVLTLQPEQAQSLLVADLAAERVLARGDGLLPVEGQGLGETASGVEVIAALQRARSHRESLARGCDPVHANALGPVEGEGSRLAGTDGERVVEDQRRQVVHLKRQPLPLAARDEADGPLAQVRHLHLALVQGEPVTQDGEARGQALLPGRREGCRLWRAWHGPHPAASRSPRTEDKGVSTPRPLCVLGWLRRACVEREPELVSGLPGLVEGRLELHVPAARHAGEHEGVQLPLAADPAERLARLGAYRGWIEDRVPAGEGLAEVEDGLPEAEALVEGLAQGWLEVGRAAGEEGDGAADARDVALLEGRPAQRLADELGEAIVQPRARGGAALGGQALELADERFHRRQVGRRPFVGVEAGLEGLGEGGDATGAAGSPGEVGCGERQERDDEDGGRRQRVAAGLSHQLAGEALAPREDGLAGAEALQVLGQCESRGVAVGGRLGEGLEADGLEVAVDAGIELAWWGRLVGLDLADDLHPGAQKRRVLAQQFVEHGAEGVDVGERADLMGAASGLLGGHVGGGAHDLA